MGTTGTPSLTIELLGRPMITRASGETYQFRSRKSWAVLAYLIISERRPSRSELAGLLFGDADDPARALRWSLAEVRRALGDLGRIDGDPVELTLPADAAVDVDVLTHGTWSAAVGLRGLGAELLAGSAARGSGAYESWLLAQQRHLAGAAEAILHEAALGSMSGGDLNAALGYAVRAVTLNPLDENHQAVLIRLYRLAGDDDAAERQYALCGEIFERDLGVEPGAAVIGAYRERSARTVEVADDAAIEALVEAGSAAVAAGAVEAGVRSLETATRLADRSAGPRLQVAARLALAETLIHALGGLDEPGLASLYQADEIADRHGMRAAVADIRAELGYVDFLRARYDRAERWLRSSLAQADATIVPRAKALTYLGCVASDRGRFGEAHDLLDQAVALAIDAGQPRRQAYGLSMLGRLHLLTGDLAAAEEDLAAAIDLAQRDHWLAFLPWPQSLLGEVRLAQDDLTGAAAVLEQAYARACQLGDPCWEGLSGHGLGLLAERRGDVARAFSTLIDARARCRRLADPYVWLDGYILDTLTRLGRRHGHPDTESWAADLAALTARTRMSLGG